MSGAPKRLHEEGGHPITSKRPLEENSVLPSLSGKLIQPVASDRLSTEVNPDGRVIKIQRIDLREAEKRTPLLSGYRIPSPANGSSLDYSGTSDNRPELRDLKDGRDVETESRETKTENRAIHTETVVDPQSNKGENDVKQDSRVDSKEIRSEREPPTDFKLEPKLEKDSCAAANPHSNWKENKEPHRALRFPESSGDGLDSWRVPRPGLHNAVEVGKEILSGERRESSDPHEAVGENKLELKAEEKIREKERKRKDEKHREWGERDKDKHDRHNNLHLNNSGKELLREDRDPDRWDRERKDTLKEKDLKGRERDIVKKTSTNLGERETIDGSIKLSEKEHMTSESKKPKDVDSWKLSDRENKDKKRDRDTDAEIDRHDRRNKGLFEKESDDGYADDSVIERDREAFGSGIQQRRRMLRPRGTSQASHREPSFRSRSREIEGSQAEKSEVSSIVYKVGECMQELLRSWKEFEATQDGRKDASAQNGPVLEIRIPAEHLTATNRQVRGGQLWGTDIYTDDSDLVAVLVHAGYCRPTSSPPPAAIQELRATVRVLPPQDCYTSTLRNNVRSRAWGAGIKCSFRVERCCIVKKGGGTIELEPRLTHISAVEPTLAPVSVERTMTTRSAASNALRQQRFVREVTVQYNLCNEPWLKYSINVVADKGLKKPQYTSARLKKGEVLYLETRLQRFELCFTGEKVVSNGTTPSVSSAPESGQEKYAHHNSHFYSGDRNHDHHNIVDVFRWSRCKKPLPQKFMRTVGIPLPIDYLEILEENLDWEDLQWSQTGVCVAGKEYILARVHFISLNTSHA